MDIRMHYLYLLHSSITKDFCLCPSGKAIGAGLCEWVLFRKYLEADGDIDTLAEQMGVLRDEVTAHINGWLGERFLTVRKKLRVHDAAELLLSRPELTLAEISRMVGFQDKSDFRKAFTTEKGIPPGLWRECRGSRIRYAVRMIREAGRNRCPSRRMSE